MLSHKNLTKFSFSQLFTNWKILNGQVCLKGSLYRFGKRSRCRHCIWVRRFVWLFFKFLENGRIFFFKLFLFLSCSLYFINKISAILHLSVFAPSNHWLIKLSYNIFLLICRILKVAWSLFLVCFEFFFFFIFVSFS